MRRKNTVDDLYNLVDYMADDECWLWLGSCTPNGYPLFPFEGETYYAYRLIYEAFVGHPLSLSKVLDHLCRTSMCVNPHHLEEVTQATNVQRGLAIFNGRNMAQKTHCPQGHEYSQENTHVYVIEGEFRKRICKVCRLETMQRNRQLYKLRDNRIVNESLKGVM